MDTNKRLNFMKWSLLGIALSVMGQTFAADEPKKETTTTAPATAAVAEKTPLAKKVKRLPNALRQLFQSKKTEEVIQYCQKELTQAKTKEASLAENPSNDARKKQKKNEWDHNIALATFHLDWIINHKDTLTDKEAGLIGRQCLVAIKKAYYLSGDKKHQFSE